MVFTYFNEGHETTTPFHRTPLYLSIPIPYSPSHRSLPNTSNLPQDCRNGGPAAFIIRPRQSMISPSLPPPPPLPPPLQRQRRRAVLFQRPESGVPHYASRSPPNPRRDRNRKRRRRRTLARVKRGHGTGPPPKGPPLIAGWGWEGGRR